MSYKRDIENTSKAIFQAENYWEIPIAKGTDVDIRDWQENTGGIAIGFNYCKSYIAKGMDTTNVGVHFFLEDYQFERVWQRPLEYIKLLKQYKFVCSPDFSLYTNHPHAVQMYNHFKKQWLNAYWESQGLTVIPTICWSDSKSFEWCFEGVPKNTTVAIATKGIFNNINAKEKFYAVYYQMMKRLEPKQILLFGKNPGALDGNVIEMGYEMSDAIKRRSDGR